MLNIFKKLNMKGFTGLELLVPIAIIGIALGIFAWVTCPFEDKYLVKDAVPYKGTVYQKHYSDGELMSKHWYSAADSAIATRTEYLIKIYFPDNERVFYRNIWHVKIDGEWKKCVCWPDGKFLLVGCKTDYPPWTMSKEESAIRDLIGIE